MLQSLKNLLIIPEGKLIFNYEGIMKVYSYSVNNTGEETFIYYMYDTTTGNSVKYTDNNEEF